MVSVSFDFDSTLSRVTIQDYAQSLIKRGIDVYVTTSRVEPDKAPNKNWNDDLFKVTDKLGISRNKITFTNYVDKWEVIGDRDFIWHLDDDWIELNLLNRNTKIVGISCFGSKNWKQKCEKLLKSI